MTPPPDMAMAPRIMPFAPTLGGANTIDLSVLDPSLAGQKVTFTAAMVGARLEIKQINIVTPASNGLHVVHPLWSTWDASGVTATPDPGDTFSNLDEQVPAATTQLMIPGTVYLNFAPGQLINVVFQTVATYQASSDGGVVGCKNVGTFTSAVQPVLSQNCVTCHGGANASASAAFSMAKVNDTSTAGQQEACLGVLGEIDTKTPAMSRIYLYTEVNHAQTHPFTYTAGGATPNWADTWINLEK
jgi:hypothetical protein